MEEVRVRVPGRRLLGSLLLAAALVASACSGPSEGAPGEDTATAMPSGTPGSTPAAEATSGLPGTSTLGTSTPGSQAPGAGTSAPSAHPMDTCEDVAAVALARIDALLVSLEGVVDDDETLDDLLLRLVSDQSLEPELEPLLDLAPGRPFAGLGGADAEQRYADLGCDVEGEYPALDAWFVARYGGAFPGLAAGGRDVLVEEVFPSIDAAGESLVVAALANRRYHVGPPDGGSAAELAAVLLEAVEAQEAHRAATGRYARVEAELAPYGFDSVRLLDEEDYFFIIWEADEDAYCMGVSRQGSAYVESHDATPVVENRIEPCPNTFAE